MTATETTAEYELMILRSIGRRAERRRRQDVPDSSGRSRLVLMGLFGVAWVATWVAAIGWGLAALLG